MVIVLLMIGGLIVLFFALLVRQIEREQQYRRVLMRKLIDAQEDERKRIAYDLHDGLIQQLVGANMYFSMLRDRRADEIDQNDLAHGVEALSGAIAEGRRIIQGLHPSSLDDLGLEDAIAELSHQQSILYGWQLELELEKLPSRPDRIVSVMVYRIVQEALNNIGKHACAEQVRVRLTNGKALQLMIEDNGVGFDLARVNGSSGLGIGTMCERAVLMGGQCHVDSEPQRGTRVTIKLPYQELLAAS